MAEPAQKKARTERTFLFSSESVNEGHPDKLCDQVSDAVLDTCLAEDPKSKVACETATKDNMVAVMGEITTQAKIDYEKVDCGVVKIGCDAAFLRDRRRKTLVPNSGNLRNAESFQQLTSLTSRRSYSTAGQVRM